jgi:GAF domain-containing protein
MSDGLRLAAVMAEVAETFNSAPAELEETLVLITDSARDAVPGVDSASITVMDDGVPRTLAPTDEVALRADEIQYDLGEGPCVDVLKEGERKRVDDLGAPHQWPRYGPMARDLGVAAQMGVCLVAPGAGSYGPSVLGALNLYSYKPDTFDEESVEIGELFARHAALALSRTRTEGQLNQALVTRKAIGAAIGIVMERYGLTEHRALQFLMRVSQTGNVKLRIVCAELVKATNSAGGRG